MKDTEALITSIVRAVVQQLQPPLSVALVLAPAGDAHARAALAREVEQRLTHNLRGGDSPMRVSFDESGLESDPHGGAAPALYVIPELSCSDMADLAAGKASSLNMHRVLDLLLAGKPVRTLGFAFRAHAATAPLALLRVYEGYAAQLARYGLTELPARTKDATLREMLVTAEQVKQIAAQGATVLRVPHDAVVTPLAQQVAAEEHVTLLKNL